MLKFKIPLLISTFLTILLAVHYHNTIFDRKVNNQQYVINYSDKEKSLKLNEDEISKIYKIKNKKKKNKDIDTQKVKIDLNNFIKQYNL